MSLLSVTVKKAHYVGPQATQFNTYVTLKLQNVKSTTVTVKGSDPCWEQDFLFETNDVTAGLLVEVWNKGMIWDRAIGYHWLPLQSVQISNEEGCGRWVPLAGELIVRGSEVVGTAGSTGHALLLDCRFELPFGRRLRLGRFWHADSMLSTLPWMLSSPCEDLSPYDYSSSNSYRPYKTGGYYQYDAEGIEAAELQRKLDLLNNLAGQERADQARRQLQYTANSGYSEDSDYTSDLNFPVGQHPNSSASQFKSAAHQLHTPTRSFETSRENSYERDEVMYGGGGGHIMRGAHDDGYGGDPRGGWDQDPDPLYYNSRPRYTQEYTRMDGWRQTQLPGQQSMESDNTSFHSAVGPPTRRMRAYSPSRKPSLERQNTSYDETCDITPTYTSQPQFSQQTSYEEFYDTSSFPYQSTDEYSLNEDRQWDSGGYYFGRDLSSNDRSSVNTMVEYENTINKRRSSVIQLPQIPTKTRPHSVISETYGGTPTRRLPRLTGRGLGRGTPEVKSRGASLPATPPGTPKIPRQLPRPPAPASLPPAPTTPRMLPRPPSSASQVYDGLKSYNKTYNEDYNYGYDSLEDQSAINIIDSTDTTDYVWPRKRLPVVTESSRKLPAPPTVSRSSNINNYQVDLQIDDKTALPTYTATTISYDSNNYISSDLQDTYNKDYSSTLDNTYTNSSYPTYTTSQQSSFTITETIQSTTSYISPFITTDSVTTSYSMKDQPYSTEATVYSDPYCQEQTYSTTATTQYQTPYIVEDKSYIDDSNYNTIQDYSEEQKPQPYVPDDQQNYTDDQYMNESYYSAESQPYVEEQDQFYNEQKPYEESYDSTQGVSSYPTATTAANYTTDTSYSYNQQVNGSGIMSTGVSGAHEPYYNESEPYYEGETPYLNKDLNSYQHESYQTPVTTSYQNTSYISDDNQIPYSSSQWMPSDTTPHIPTSMSTAKVSTSQEIPKSLPSSQSSTFQAGLAGAPVVAAAAAQTFGRFMASGAMKLGSFLSSAAPKPTSQHQPTTTTLPAQTQVTPAVTTTTPYSASTTASSMGTPTNRPQLRQQVSITEPEPYHPYSQDPQDSVPTMNYQNDPYASSDQGYSNYGDDYYKDMDMQQPEHLDYTKHNEISLQDDDYNNGMIKQHDLDNHYSHNGTMDEYTADEQGFVSDHSKTQNGGSPVSVIHMAERMEPVSGSFEEDDHRKENSLVEPYRPKAMSPSAVGSRKTSMEAPYRSSPSHDGSQLMPTVKDMLSETIMSPPPDIRLPQANHIGEIETGSIIGAEEKTKIVSFEEAESARRPAGARQRWHWAYAKILMQLNRKRSQDEKGLRHKKKVYLLDNEEKKQAAEIEHIINSEKREAEAHALRLRWEAEEHEMRMRILRKKLESFDR